MAYDISPLFISESCPTPSNKEILASCSTYFQLDYFYTGANVFVVVVYDFHAGSRATVAVVRICVSVYEINDFVTSEM